MRFPENQVKNWAGILFMIGHIATFLHLFYLRYYAKQFSSETFTVAVFIILPMFTIYTSLIITHFIDTRSGQDEPRQTVTSLFTTITVLLILGFTVFLNFQISSQTSPDLLENFSRRIGFTETIFGVFLAMIFKKLFTANQTK